MGAVFYPQTLEDLCDLMCPPARYTILYEEDYDEFHVYDGDTVANVFKTYDEALDWVEMMEE